MNANSREYFKIFSAGPKTYKQRFLVRSGNSYKYLITEDIASFMAEDGVVFARCLSGGKSIVENNLTELVQVLDPGQFYQINRNTIVSIGAVFKISNYFNRRVIVQLLPDKFESIVSRERVQGFKEWLNK